MRLIALKFASSLSKLKSILSLNLPFINPNLIALYNTEVLVLLNFSSKSFNV